MARVWVGVACLMGMVCPAVPEADAGTKPGLKPIEVKVPSRKQPASYVGEVAEILENKCVGCHGGGLAANKLSLETVSAMHKGGKRGPALVPGKAEESLLFRMAAHRVEPVMPPIDKPGNSPLNPDELGVLKLWIDQGAKDDSDSQSAAAKAKHTKAIVLGDLPPGVQPINALDLTGDGSKVAAGRANVVQVYNIDSGLEIASLGGHKDLIQSVRFSPDGSLLAAGSYQIVTVWTVPTGSMAKALTGHGGPVHALAISADRKWAYSGSQDSTIRVWNLAEGKLGWTLSQPAAVTALAVIPDGKTLVAGGADGVIRLVNAADCRERLALKGHGAAIEGLAVLPTAAKQIRIVSASADGSARIWSLDEPAAPADPKKAASPPVGPKPVVLQGHKGPVHAVAVAPDGSLIATGGEDGSVRLWQASDGKTKGMANTGHSGPILALAISPDGKLLATGSADKTARLLALSGTSPVRILEGHPGAVHSVAFSPKGDRVATAGTDGTMKVWETGIGQGVIAFGHATPGAGAIQAVRQVAFHSDGGLVSASADGSLKTWSFRGSWSLKESLGPHAFRVLSLDFSPDGKLLATGGGEPSRSGEIKLWDVGKGSLIRSIESLHSDTVFALRFSPDGTRLASGAADKFLKVCQVSDGKELRSFEGHTHHVMAVDWKSDGKQIISGGGDKVLKLWEFDSGEQVRTLQEAGKQITSARWIAGKPEVVAASGDAKVRTWNPESGAVSRVFSGPGDYVYGVAASADGTRIAAGGADSNLFIWNGQNGQVVRKLEPSPPRPGSPATPRTASTR